MSAALIIGSRPTGGPRSFGITTRELMTRVLGFRIQIDTNSDAITHIENIVSNRPSTRPSPTTSRWNFEFVLIGDEHVTRVVYANGTGRSQDTIQAIRFETNLRVSQWFGNFYGTKETELDAPHRYFLHSLCGERVGFGFYSTLSAVAWHSESLGVRRVVGPVPVQAPVELLDKCVIEAAVSSVGQVFHSSECGGIGAVVVRYDGKMRGIDVVSKTEYQRFAALIPQLSLPLSEHVVELVANEAIVGVGYFVQDTALVGLRLETSRRHTPWIGQDKETQVIKHGSYRCASGAHICGFFASPSDGFGVVVARKGSA